MPCDSRCMDCPSCAFHDGKPNHHHAVVQYKMQCPTTIVPFFGDQFFWGDRLHQRGLGPPPIPISQLTVEGLSEAIRFMLQPEVCIYLSESWYL